MIVAKDMVNIFFLFLVCSGFIFIWSFFLPKKKKEGKKKSFLHTPQLDLSQAQRGLGIFLGSDAPSSRASIILLVVLQGIDVVSMDVVGRSLTS